MAKALDYVKRGCDARKGSFACTKLKELFDAGTP